ncbi:MULTISPECIES: DUF4954 family protein [Chitinophagaceae]
MPQNNIIKKSLDQLGYHFIADNFIPEGKDEYYLRNQQNRSGIDYRHLTASEIESLVQNRNTSDNWNNLLVSDDFNPKLVRNCKFFGLVRIGKLESITLEFSQLIVPVGLYNSTIISCDFGDNIAVSNVHYMAHYIVGDEVILTNIDELITTNHSKFGNGIVKEGEDESVRIWLELCNENGGRKVLPFNSMLPGDAWLWSKYRTDKILLEKFKIFTETEFKTHPGYYGKIGNRTVIKNTGILKDVWIGSDAYIKGASKIKNVTINSGEEGRTQIGEGCEIVNGIIGFGCRIFYGVKAVRFVMGSHSQLKYGARLINSYLGSNSTISCCEVLNSLIFPAHEQHHNNSFLCAALIMGQSNIPAGATLGSNHNSRSPDGEFIAKRGFWPALCSNIKHNSIFASFTMIARGNYANELHIPIPFSLVSINEQTNNLEIMVGYWFLYNMYALTRNAWKYPHRDERIEKIQHIEYDYLAPDTIEEMLQALHLMETTVGKAFASKQKIKEGDYQMIGKELLEKKDPIVNQLEIILEGIEHSNRKTVLTKCLQGYHAFKTLIDYYSLKAFFQTIKSSKDHLYSITPIPIHRNWLNVGGQLIPEEHIAQLRKDIHSGKLDSWDDIHHFYKAEGESYDRYKTAHALSLLAQSQNIDTSRLSHAQINNLLDQYVQHEQTVLDAIIVSRKKDYTSTFRKMIYDSEEEMNEVLGTFDGNSFILQKEKELETLKESIDFLKQR